MPHSHRNHPSTPTSLLVRCSLLAWVLLLSACWIQPSEMDVDRDGYRVGEDCDDGDPLIHPGYEETCDGKDNDCDGGTDDDGVCPADCGTGVWGDLAVDAETIYVDQAAEPEGDGSESRPYATIQQGLDRAGALGGGLVAVAEGTYTETLSMTSDHAGVELAGRCREMVILDASVGDEETAGIALDLGNGASEMYGLTVRGSAGPGIHVASGTVAIRFVEIAENTVAGLSVAGSDVSVTLQDALIRNTQPDGEGFQGYGIQVGEGATLDVDSCMIEANTAAGVYAFGSGTVVTLQETAIGNTRPEADGDGGYGIFVETGAKLDAESCALEANSTTGIMVLGPDTDVALFDTTVTKTLTNADGLAGNGIIANHFATLYAEGCTLEGNTSSGVSALDLGTVVTLLETDIRDTQPDGNGDSGFGIEVSHSSSLDAVVCDVEANAGVGISVVENAFARIIYSNVRNTVPVGDGGFGCGIEVSGGGILEMESGAIESNAGVGVLAIDQAVVSLRGTTVRDTQPDANGDDGYGIAVADGATLNADTCWIEANTGVGILAEGPDTQVTLSDTTVGETQPDLDGDFGYGIEASGGAILEADDCMIEWNTAAGVVASDPLTTVTLLRTSILDTRSDADGNNGYGILVFDGATMDVDTCWVEANTGAGIVERGPDTQVTLSDTTVGGTQPDPDGSFGYGIDVSDGASLNADACTVEANSGMGLSAMGPDTLVTLAMTSVRGTIPGSAIDSSCAIGVSAQDGAYIGASDLSVTSNEGPGIFAYGDGATVECNPCSIDHNQFAGAAALSGGTLTITDSTIEDTTPNVNLQGGVGVYAWPWKGGPPTVVLTNTVIEDNPIAGVLLIGNGTYSFTGNTISGGIGESFGEGYKCGDAVQAIDGITAWDGSSGLLLQDNILQDAEGAGIFLDDSSALLSGNTYSENAIDLVVQNQSCDSLPECYLEAPLRDLCPAYGYPTCYAEFFFEAKPADPVD